MFYHVYFKNVTVLLLKHDGSCSVKYGRFAHAMKNKQYNPYLWPNCRNFLVLKEIGVEEHDDYIRF